MSYRERLSVPLLWWVIAIAFSLTFVVAVAVFLDMLAAVAVTMLTVVGLAIFLLLTAPSIGVDADGVTAAKARLEWPYVGEVTIMRGPEVIERLRGRADPRAYLVYRGFVPDAVEIEVRDPADPHPYWLISTRNPESFADAIARARGSVVAS